MTNTHFWWDEQLIHNSKWPGNNQYNIAHLYSSVVFLLHAEQFLAQDLVQSSSGGAEHLVMFRLTGLSTVNRLSMALTGCREF